MDDTEHKKRCPYCHEEMAPGLLHGGGGKAITWLPEDLYPRDLGGGFLAVTMAKKSWRPAALIWTVCSPSQQWPKRSPCAIIVKGAGSCSLNWTNA